MFASKAQAQDTIYVPLFTYRTGPYADSGIPIANGMHDYLTMLNERDGGIGGVKLNVEECETGYDTKKGVECWESIKGKNPTVVNPYSTGITLQLIPKAVGRQDPDPVDGLRPVGVGGRQGLPVDLQSAGDLLGRHVDDHQVHRRQGRRPRQAQGQDRSASSSSRAATAASRSRCSQQLAKDYGFNVKLYSVAGKEMQDQSSQWLAVRRDRPAWMIMWGWGAMNPTAVKRAAENGYPMDHFIGIWWSGSDDDARGGGQAAKGYLALNFNGLGANYPAIQDIKKYVVDKGKSQVEKDKFARQLLQPRRLQLRADRGSDPQCAEADRQEGRGRRGRAPRSRNAEHHRRALEGARFRRTSPRRSPV